MLSSASRAAAPAAALRRVCKHVRPNAFARHTVVLSSRVLPSGRVADRRSGSVRFAHDDLPGRFRSEHYTILPTESEAEDSAADEEAVVYTAGEELDEEQYLAQRAADEFRTDDSEGYPVGVIGDDPLDVPRAILEHFTNPLDMHGPGIDKALEELKHDIPLAMAGDSGGEDDTSFNHSNDLDEEEDDFQKFKRPSAFEESTRLDQFRELKAKIEDPIPIPTRPLWPLFTQILQVDTVTTMSTRGQESHTRVLVVVGNKRGGAGFGIGKHKEPAMASKYALRNAQRDMIHVNTHNGQLYHDLIGKKNNTQVILRSVPPRMQSRGSRMIKTVMEFMGITSYSAKIVGSKTKNRYTIIQALFDAFNHHTPPEEFAYKRGKRMVWVGKDRRYPREVFPMFPKGPRFQPNKHGH